MKSLNKKAVSPVIATVLIILATVAAAGIIASMVVPFVRDNLDSSTECLAFQDYYEFESSIKFSGEEYNYNCHLPGDGKYGFSVKAGVLKDKVENLMGFKIVLYKENGESKVLEIPGSDVEIIGVPDLRPAKEGEIITYYHTSEEEFKRMEIYPLLKSGKSCERTDEIKIVSCAANIDFS